jgi:hypothetical protein
MKPNTKPGLLDSTGKEIDENRLFDTPPDELTKAEMQEYLTILRSYRVAPRPKAKKVSKKQLELDALKKMIDGED